MLRYILGRSVNLPRVTFTSLDSIINTGVCMHGCALRSWKSRKVLDSEVFLVLLMSVLSIVSLLFVSSRLSYEG